MRTNGNTPIHIGDIKAQAHEAQNSPEAKEKILTLIHSDNAVEARNAAWVMTHFCDREIRLMSDRHDEFIDLAMTTSNSSLRRLMLNIVERQDIREEDLRSDFLDFCLTHMVSPTEEPGIQSLCMKLAYKQCKFFPELLDEFKSTLEMMEDGYATCIQSLRKKFLKILQLRT